MSAQTFLSRLERAAIGDTDDIGRALVVTQVGLLFATFAGFLAQSQWTLLFLASFLVLTGISWVMRQAVTARAITLAMTVSTLVTLGLIAFFLFLEAIPAFERMGLGILAPIEGDMWSTSTNVYSLVPMIWGTLVTTVVATVFAAPFGIAGALFISEIAPGWLRDIVKPAVEILAGIPSIVYGFIGFTIINPYVSIQLSGNFGALFVIGLVIGFMALPTVVSVAEDAITSVPDPMKSGSLALGATDWQTMKNVTVPAAFSGVSAAVLLGIGRAMGETMAATVMIAHSRRLPEPLFNVFDSTETLTTLIAAGYGPAVGTKYYMSALFAAGVVLFTIVTTLGIASQLVEERMKRKLGGNQ